MTTQYYAHRAFGAHEVPPGHVERPGRYDAVDAALAAEPFATLDRRDAPRADPAAIERVHPSAYRAFIEENAPADAAQPTLARFDPDTYMGPSSLEAAQRGAGAAAAAAKAVWEGEADNAFVAARPPGHHAEPGKAMGFCFFNNAAIAAMEARSLGAARVAAVDFDVHHGNGVEAAFWSDEHAFYASSHEFPQYPGTGRADDRGEFDNIANAPLSSGSGGTAFRRAWGEILLPAMSDFDPDFIVISA
ncbi:MAG: histone deacetylase family protein, partial [Pseudomonadota bacterium]